MKTRVIDEDPNACKYQRQVKSLTEDEVITIITDETNMSLQEPKQLLTNETR